MTLKRKSVYFYDSIVTIGDNQDGELLTIPQYKNERISIFE